MNEAIISAALEDLEIPHGRTNRKLEALIMDTIAAHPKRRGELRAEYERRILRLAREKA